MGRRSRKQRPSGRAGATATPPRPDSTAPERAARRRPQPHRPGASRMDRMLERADARPKPPWHPVPLVEVAVLAGIVLIVVGLLNRDSSRGRLLLVFGLALASVAGLDTAAREHFAGHRSHSSLLAGLPAVALVVALAVAGAGPAVSVPVAAVVFAAAFGLLRRAFKARTGHAFKV
jgi:hypothetical protein